MPLDKKRVGERRGQGVVGGRGSWGRLRRAGLTAVTLVTEVRAVCPTVAAQVLADTPASFAHEHPRARCRGGERGIKSIAAPLFPNSHLTAPLRHQPASGCRHRESNLTRGPSGSAARMGSGCVALTTDCPEHSHGGEKPAAHVPPPLSCVSPTLGPQSRASMGYVWQPSANHISISFVLTVSKQLPDNCSLGGGRSRESHCPPNKHKFRHKYVLTSKLSGHPERLSEAIQWH